MPSKEKQEWARTLIAEARRDLGHDLAGLGPVNLLLDNDVNLSLEEAVEIVKLVDSQVRACGQREITYGESYLNWWVLPEGHSTLTEEDALLAVASFASHSPAGTPAFMLVESPLAPYSPTGRWCWDYPTVRQSRTRTLVRQRHYLDI